MQKIEIERKFLLKKLPIIAPDDKIIVHQYYLKTKNGWERARSYDSLKNGKIYVHTIKTPVDKFSNIEEEKELTPSEFVSFIKKCEKNNSSFIRKMRYIYEVGDLKWEVDKFIDLSLIIAEIEIPSEDWDLVIPDFIEKIKLLEVTELKQFSNRSLSQKYNKNGK